MEKIYLSKEKQLGRIGSRYKSTGLSRIFYSPWGPFHQAAFAHADPESAKKTVFLRF